MTTQEQMIPRGMIEITGDYFTTLFEHLDIKKTDVQGRLQYRGVFEAIKAKLLLPEQYTILGVYCQPWMTPRWYILVSHPDMPYPSDYMPLPRLKPFYRRLDDGTTILDRIDIEGTRLEQEQAPLKVGDQVQYIVDAVISDIDADIPGAIALSEFSINGEPQPYIDFSTGDYIPARHLRKRRSV